MDVTLNMILDYIAKEEVITLDHIHTHVGFSDIRVYYPGTTMSLLPSSRRTHSRPAALSIPSGKPRKPRLIITNVFCVCARAENYWNCCRIVF